MTDLPNELVAMHFSVHELITFLKCGTGLDTINYNFCSDLSDIDLCSGSQENENSRADCLANVDVWTLQTDPFVKLGAMIDITRA